jgi:hypothetical protein
LANQLGIHLILAKIRKIGLQQFSKSTGKNRNLAKLTSPRVYMRAWIVVAIGGFPLGGRVKKEIKNREGILM